jgi:hypothetical protein
MHPRRRLQASGTQTIVTSDLGGEQHLGVAAHLVDLDVCKMRKKLLDGHHTA